MALLELVFSGFWAFLGFIVIFTVILQWIYKMVTAPMRAKIIEQHGYPPEHCDSLGLLKSKSDDDDDDDDDEMYSNM